jgi:four helix bundle protein
MKYRRFEDVPVWQDGMTLTERIYLLTEHRAFDRQGDLRNQLQRAGLSVPNNIAEGFERGTTQELITFLYYARGSAGEVRSMFCLCERLPRFGDLRSEISNLRSLAESVSRQIRGWADSLQNSDIRGQRHLTDKSRAIDEQRRRAEAFLEKLKEMGQRPKAE